MTFEHLAHWAGALLIVAYLAAVSGALVWLLAVCRGRMRAHAAAFAAAFACAVTVWWWGTDGREPAHAAAALSAAAFYGAGLCMLFREPRRGRVAAAAAIKEPDG